VIGDQLLQAQTKTDRIFTSAVRLPQILLLMSEESILRYTDLAALLVVNSNEARLIRKLYLARSRSARPLPARSRGCGIAHPSRSIGAAVIIPNGEARARFSALQCERDEPI
jgi:hypothetical protein